MMEFNTNLRVLRSCPETDRRIWNARACWGGTWWGHANLDYDRLLHWGTNGIRHHIEKCRANYSDKTAFYNACRTAMDAVDIIGDRIHQIAEANSAHESAYASEWKRIAETYTRIPREPAYDMYSAVMFFWMVFTLDGVDSPRRLDQFMIDFYRISPVEESRSIIRRMLEAIQCTGLELMYLRF